MHENLAEVERRIEEARRDQAESLDLGDLALSELPASLGNLPGLKTLFLGTEKSPRAVDFESRDSRASPRFADLTPLASLRGLQSLDLANCREVADLSPLAGLENLQSLNLNWTDAEDLSPLASLREARTLQVRGCRVTDLTPLSGLRELQHLVLTATDVADLSPLSGLQELKSLHLGMKYSVDLLTRRRSNKPHESLTDLTPLSYLRQLKHLEIPWYEKITDLSPLANLRELEHLDLFRCTSVEDFSPLTSLTRLRNLDLTGTNIRDLSLLVGVKSLQNLDLRECSHIENLTPLAELHELRELDLSRIGFPVPAIFLRLLAQNPHLTKLVIDSAVGLPEEVISHLSEDFLPRLRIYFAELELGAEIENEVKIILLGNGRVGKTQLCRRLRGQSFDESVESTHGVQIWREEWRIRTGGQEQAFELNWWDFGGQDIYHGTHALFLRSRAVFLILWTPKLENQKEYEDSGLPLRNQPLAYWIDYVRTLAGESSPIIVVQSQCDRLKDRRPDPTRPEGVGFFECCAYSARTEEGRETLESHLRNAIRYLVQQHGRLEIGHGRAEVRRRLYEWRSKGQPQTLTLEDFRALCDEAGGIVAWEQALDYFHQTGVVFYEPYLFSNRIILDQNWALGAVYTVFQRGRAAPWLRDSGRFTREDLALLVWQEYSIEEQRLFLGLMESCGVCFSCGKTIKGEDRYIAPDLLPRFEIIAPRLHAWKEELDTPTLRLKYRFFHLAIIRGLMSQIGWQAGELAEYWKYGLWLKDSQRDTQLLVQLEDTSTVEAPGSGALVLKAQGHEPLGLLREIRNSIPLRWIGEQPEELLTLDGFTVARDELSHAINGRLLDFQKRPVSAAAFSAFFEDRDASTCEIRKMIDIHPQRPDPIDKPQKEVFISYAWGDETVEGRLRSQVVDALYSALGEAGFLPVRDRDQIRPGEPISAFLRRLTRADLIVAVISDRYLRSFYCMTEIHGLWQRSQEDANLLAECLVPIILPEVNIEGLRTRASYVRYWREKRDELEKLFRELGPDLDPGSLRELHLVRDFAQNIDGILIFLQDVLMPRKLEAHLDNGFEAVLDALRRRTGAVG